VETTGDRCRVLSAIRNGDHWRAIFIVRSQR
jgi:hypothetical protein